MNNKEPLFKRMFKIFKASGLPLFVLFISELIEELLEEAIAFGITSVFTMFVAKALSVVGVVLLTQVIKKGLIATVKPIVKTFTYKEGNDKMSKVKKFFSWIGKGFKWIFANKKSLTGIASGAVMTLSGTGVIDVSVLPELPVNGFNVTPVIYYGVLLVLAIIGVSGKGFESIKTFFERKALEKAAKEEKAIIKEAEAELKAEQKLANQTQAEQEKAKAKAEADAKAKAEKEKADAEHKALVEKAKAKILAENKK